jgi:hypothetical protein
MAKRGLATGRLIAEWRTIVGPSLADSSLPQRLTRPQDGAGGTLTIKVRPGAAIEVQHWEPLIVERINAHFGFRAVDHLRLVQGVVPRPPGAPVRPPVVPVDDPVLTGQVAGIDDPELRDALLRLGRRVRAPTAAAPGRRGPR